MYAISKKYLLVEARIYIFDWGIPKLFSVKIYIFHKTFQSLTNTFCKCNKYNSLMDRVHWLAGKIATEEGSWSATESVSSLTHQEHKDLSLLPYFHTPIQLFLFYIPYVVLMVFVE